MLSLLPPQPNCNASATRARRSTILLLVEVCLCVIALTAPARAQQAQQEKENETDSRVAHTLAFLGGAATALVVHEAAHVVTSAAFGAEPGLKAVNFKGIPFFAISHAPVSRRREFVISSAGFWVQHATDEWLLTRRPGLRREQAPFAKGMLAFNVVTSVAYGGVALARTGPVERDTRGIAVSYGPHGMDERWVGVLVLAPAVLDAYRYFVPEARWAVWASRAVKLGMVVMAIR